LEKGGAVRRAASMILFAIFTISNDFDPVIFGLEAAGKNNYYF
jgi:hypothetical protein